VTAPPTETAAAGLRSAAIGGLNRGRTLQRQRLPDPRSPEARSKGADKVLMRLNSRAAPLMADCVFGASDIR